MIVCEAPRRRGCILLCDAWLDETGVLHSIMMVHGQCWTRAWDLATRELRGETGRESFERSPEMRATRPSTEARRGAEEPSDSESAMCRCGLRTLRRVENGGLRVPSCVRFLAGARSEK